MKSPLHIIAYCRKDFERECAIEISARFELNPKSARTGSGFVTIPLPQAVALSDARLNVKSYIFARQIFCGVELANLANNEKKAEPLAQALLRVFHLLTIEPLFSSLHLEAMEHASAEGVAAFCRKLERPLLAALKRAEIKQVFSKKNLSTAFVALPNYDQAFVGLADPSCCSPWERGIPRLKHQQKSPSRSYLKIEEAIGLFLNPSEQQKLLRKGLHALDLGAAPGGWTLNLLERGLHVTAVDHAQLKLPAEFKRQLSHVREDAFRFHPDRAYDWVVCDILDKPKRVLDLIAKYLKNDWAQSLFVNFKLSPKTGLHSILEIKANLDNICRRSGKVVRVKQLYHDRDEVSVMIVPISDDTEL